MATELTVQSERAFQKQPHIFLNSKRQSGKTKRVGKGGRRWFKDVGLGFRTPKNAIEGSYIGRLSTAPDFMKWKSQDGILRKRRDLRVCDTENLEICKKSAADDKLTISQTRSAHSLVLFPSVVVS